jgi:predicted branched-subunit amino acid permease
MSATTFAGSAQFAVASILNAGGGITTAMAAAILLNARYGPIGLSVAPDITGSMWARLIQSQLVVDESWAVARRADGRFDRRILVGAGLALYVAWILGTVAGVAFGDLLGSPTRLGLDAAFPALFLGLLLPQLRNRRALVAAGLGGTVSLVLIPFARPGVPIIASCIGCLAGLKPREAP